MKLQITKWDEDRDGKLSRCAMMEKLRHEGYNAVTYSFAPGTTFSWHRHGCSKKDSIVSGKFLFKTKDDEVVLEPGDMLEVPAGLRHFAQVVGNEPVEFFDASKTQ
eukprot:jgi/Astpho2/8255/Aster-01339